MEWISVNFAVPPVSDEFGSQSAYFLVTDGNLIGIGFFVHNSELNGCFDDDDDEKEKTCPETPHWHMDDISDCYLKSEKCFGFIRAEDITHWMPLPEIPDERT